MKSSGTEIVTPNVSAFIPIGRQIQAQFSGAIGKSIVSEAQRAVPSSS